MSATSSAHTVESDVGRASRPVIARAWSFARRTFRAFGSTLVAEPFARVAFALGAIFLVEIATDTPFDGDRYLGPFYRLTPATWVTSSCSAVVLVSLALWPLLARRSPAALGVGVRSVGGYVARLLPLPAMVLALLWARPHVTRRFATSWRLMAVGAILVLSAAALRRWRPLSIAAVAAVVGTFVRVVDFVRFPIEDGADMLPLTNSALTSFVAGHTPYAYYHLPDPLPLTYFPLTWLAYAPPFVAHVDIRITNIAAHMAILAALVLAGRPSGARRVSVGAPGASLLLWSVLYLLPSSVFFDRITTAPVSWALMAWTIVLAVRESRWTWLLAALTAAATPLAAVVDPFLFLAWWKGGSLRTAIARAAKAVGVATAVMAPFFVWSPRGFLDGTVLWFNDLARYPTTQWNEHTSWERYVGFGSIFWRHGDQRFLAPTQLVLVAVLAFSFARRAASPQLLASYAAAALVAFMAFNSVHWAYFYQAAIFCGLVAVASYARDRRPSDHDICDAG